MGKAVKGKDTQAIKEMKVRSELKKKKKKVKKDTTVSTEATRVLQEKLNLPNTQISKEAEVKSVENVDQQPHKTQLVASTGNQPENGAKDVSVPKKKKKKGAKVKQPEKQSEENVSADEADGARLGDVDAPVAVNGTNILSGDGNAVSVPSVAGLECTTQQEVVKCDTERKVASKKTKSKKAKIGGSDVKEHKEQAAQLMTSVEKPDTTVKESKAEPKPVQSGASADDYAKASTKEKKKKKTNSKESTEMRDGAGQISEHVKIATKEKTCGAKKVKKGKKANMKAADADRLAEAQVDQLADPVSAQPCTQQDEPHKVNGAIVRLGGAEEVQCKDADQPMRDVKEEEQPNETRGCMHDLKLVRKKESKRKRSKAKDDGGVATDSAPVTEAEADALAAKKRKMNKKDKVAPTENEQAQAQPGEEKSRELGTKRKKNKSNQEASKPNGAIFAPDENGAGNVVNHVMEPSPCTGYINGLNVSDPVGISSQKSEPVVQNEHVSSEPTSDGEPAANEKSQPEKTPVAAPKAFFRRVKSEEWLGKKGSMDNTYEGTFGTSGWGHKAQQVLGQVRGKDFRHEKTKKKRGSYMGGKIDAQATASFKYDSD